MATSGTSTFSTTRNQIINHAGRLVGAIRPGESMGPGKIGNFEYALNAMVKHWQANGLRVWTLAEGVLVPQANQQKYTIGTGSTDHTALDSDFFTTVLTDAASSGDTTVDVDDTSDVAVSDHIGLPLSDGTVHWSTVSSKTSTSITFADALADDAATDTVVFTYTTKLVRPLKMELMRRYDVYTDTETSIDLVARREFRQLSSPLSSGEFTQAFYDKKLTAGELSFWPVPNAIRNIAKFTFRRPIEDFNAAGDNPDLPQEWIMCLGFNLAKVMIPEYGIGQARAAEIKEQAAQYFDDVTNFDREDESIFFGVNMED